MDGIAHVTELQNPTPPVGDPQFVPVGRSPGLSARTAEILDRLRARRYSLGITLAVFLGVNLILLGLYLWSMGGETVHIHVIANGDEFTAYVDGEQHAIARFEAPEAGGIALILGNTEEIPSLPKPRGVDSVRVRDLATGDIVFEDNFSDGPSSEWIRQDTDLVVDGGAVGAIKETTLTLGERPWRDYSVDVKFNNPTAATLRVRLTEDNSGVDYVFRPFRHYDNGFALVSAGSAGQYVAGKPMEIDRFETVKSLLAMVLAPYPYTFVLLAVTFPFIAALVFLSPTLRFQGRLRDSLADVPWFAAAGLAAVGLVVAAFINYSYSDHMPHVPDELAYLFQAKLFSSLDLSAPIPPVPEVFDYFYPQFIVVTDGHWIGVYPFGHPLVLTLGEVIGAPWIMPAIVGAATVLLVFAIGRKVYSARVGLLAALVFVTSPFFLMTASNFMSHNTAAFFLVASLFCTVISDRRPVAYGILGGLLYGLFFNTQQLTAVALVGPVGMLLASYAVPRDTRGRTLRYIGGFLAGGFVMLGAYFLYNMGTTGDAFTNGLQIGSNPAKFVGFGGENSASLGIQNQQIQLAFLLLVLNGWPLYAGLMFVLMPFVLATRHRWDWFLIVSVVIAFGIYVLFIGPGIMHGPRYWYVASPLLALLTARGADRGAEVLTGLASELRRRIIGGDESPRWPGVIVMYAVVCALVGAGIYGWLLGRHTYWYDEFVPNKAVALKSFNNVDDQIIEAVEEQDIHDALVLVQDCQSWQCYGSVFWLNNTHLDGDIVYAKDMPARRAELFAAYPDRYVYIVGYDPVTLSPYGATGPVVIEDGRPNAPRAGEIDLPTPTPTAAPEVPNPEERDAQRVNDLGTIADALQQYYEAHDTYPLAEGLQSFCRYQDLDNGCKVSEFLPGLPRDPDNTRTYYYYSPGTSFVLWTVTDNPAPDSDCPETPKPDVDDEHLYCVQGAPPP